MKRFVEDINAKQQLSFSELKYSSFRTQIQNICQHLMNWTKWNKRDDSKIHTWRFYYSGCLSSSFFSVPDKRRVSGQWPDKEGFLSRQVKYKR